jgi:4-hydroxy-2-oxoheptanedioate aldolase
VKLRPLKGERLGQALAGEVELEPLVTDYLAHYNRQNLCIVNIESVPALSALDAILAVPDIDALLIGPHDLSINLGVPEQYSHPRFEEAVQTVIKKGRGAGVGVGIHFSDGMDHWEAWAKAGLNLILHSSDLRIVADTLTHDLTHLRRALGDTPRPTEPNNQDTPTVDV